MTGSLILLVTSGLLLLQGIQGQGLSSNSELYEEIFQEAMADGFIIGDKQRSSDKNIISQHMYHSAPSSPHHNHSTTTPPQGQTGVNAKPESFPQRDSRASTTPAPDANPEGSGDLPDTHTLIPLTANGDLRMLPENPNEVHNKNPDLSTAAYNPQVDLHSSRDVPLLPEVIDGSGINPDDATMNGFTAKPTMIVEETLQSVEDGFQDLGREEPTVNSNPGTTTKVPRRPRVNAPEGSSGLGSKPTISARADKGTPDWLIIFALCLTVGAILFVLAAIATKDKWYGPSRRTLNVEPVVSTEEYGKTATLPLSEKELQLMALVSSEKQTERDFTIISLEEKEKEYLM